MRTDAATDSVDKSRSAGPTATAREEPNAALTIAVVGDDLDVLTSRGLAIPVPGISGAQLNDTYSDKRGNKSHEALDIAAPTGTAVHAVEDGVIAKLFNSQRGGITVYQFDPSRRFAYYYAHLDSYAPGLREGQRVKRCQLLGYVGTTGNSAADAPHLHFAIFKLERQPRWWRGAPINPFAVYSQAQPASAACPASAG